MNYVSTYWTSFIRSCCYPLGQPIDEKGPINTKLVDLLNQELLLLL